MPCPCSSKKPRAAGRKVRAAADSSTRAITAAASTGRWTTTCADAGEPVRSLIKAQRAARACGGRVVPA